MGGYFEFEQNDDRVHCRDKTGVRKVNLKQYRLVHALARKSAAEFCHTAPEGTVVIFKEATRTLDQNAKLQPMCRDVAEQVVWYGDKLSVDDWRHMFVAAYRKEQRTVPGINGGFVVLGASSKKLSKKECADVIEIIYAFGAEHGVKWSDPNG